MEVSTLPEEALMNDDVTDGGASTSLGIISSNSTLSSKKKSAAMLLLKMKQQYKLSELSVDNIISDISSLWYSHLEDFKANILQYPELNLAPCKDQLDKLISEVSSQFSGLQTKFLRHEYFTKFLNLLVSNYHFILSIISHII